MRGTLIFAFELRESGAQARVSCASSSLMDPSALSEAQGLTELGLLRSCDCWNVWFPIPLRLVLVQERCMHLWML